MPRRLPFALGVPLLLLCGCATPPPQPAPPPPPAEAASTNAPATPEPAPSSAWWLLFRDPELDRRIALAQAENRDLRQAAARLDQARARARIAGADSALQLAASASALRQQSSDNRGFPFTQPPLNNLSAGLQFAYEADLWGRLRATREAALQEVELSAAERQAAELTLLAEVARQHLQQLALRRERAVLERQLASYGETETLQSARVAAGYASELDLQRVHIERATREGERSQLREREQAASLALALLCGQPQPNPATNSPPAEAVIPNLPSTLSLSLLEARPDVAARRAGWEAAFLRVQAARADLYPTLRLTGSFGYEATRAPDLLDWQSRLWSLASGLTAPVLDGGRLKSALELERARLREAAAAYEAAVLTAHREAADALNTLREASEQQAAAQRAQEAAQRALDLSRERYDKGFATYLEVVESERALLTARRTLVQLEARRQTATVDLIRALAGAPR